MRIVITAMLLISLACTAVNNPGARQDEVLTSTEARGGVVQYVFISRVGGMVGGSSATSRSHYVSRSGLIQLSVEETNGVLHALGIAQSAGSELFDRLIGNPALCPRWKQSPGDSQMPTPTEYHPPTTTLAYSLRRDDGVACEFLGQVEGPELEENLENPVLDLFAEHELRGAPSGLYARATRLLDANLDFIEFDLELARPDLASMTALSELIDNEMALIRLGEAEITAGIAADVTLKAGGPVHVRIDDSAYLIFPYRLDARGPRSGQSEPEP